METVLAQTCTDTGKTQLFLLFSLPPPFFSLLPC